LRVALFGGTFDPVHEAHLRVAREAVERFGLDEVWFVTAGNPPHKQMGTTTEYQHRHRMVELACEVDPRFIPSRLEEGTAKSYTIETIGRARRLLEPEVELFFLIGADAFAEVGTWHRSEEVIRAVEFIVVSRPGYQYPVPEGARLLRLESLALPVSSSEIRRAFAAGRRPEAVPAAVAEYAERHSLYKGS